MFAVFLKDGMTVHVAARHVTHVLSVGASVDGESRAAIVLSNGSSFEVLESPETVAERLQAASLRAAKQAKHPEG